jgi:hypothetical protein
VAKRRNAGSAQSAAMAGRNGERVPVMTNLRRKLCEPLLLRPRTVKKISFESDSAIGLLNRKIVRSLFERNPGTDCAPRAPFAFGEPY